MSFTERAGLIPVLFLTGCAQQAVITGPPSGSVVDGILSRSAADISAMQYRLHQSTPSAQRPASPSGTKAPAPLLSKPAVAAGGSSVFRSTTAPPSTAGAGPSDGFVRQGGAAPTLRAALRKIIPPGHSVVFDKAVSADAPELWQWTGNDRWPFVVDKLLAGYLHSLDYLFAFYLATVCKLLDHHQLILAYNLLLMTRPNLNGRYVPRLCENGLSLRDVRKGG